MKLTRGADAADEVMEPTNFSGPVRRRDLGRIEAPSGTALVVSFEPGSRTHWHRHPDGQVLYVLEGAGRVCVRGDEPVDLAPGDLVHAPPGEEHWHGAGDAVPMTHLALSFGETEWTESG